MNKKGQILEIPANSPLYGAPSQLLSETASLEWTAFPKAYSLFDGFLVGEHSGLDSFQPGQRKGIGVGGKDAPLYVIGKDIADNRLFVGEGENHPGLWARVFAFDIACVDDVDQCRPLPDGNPVEVTVCFDQHPETYPARLLAAPQKIFLEFEHKISVMLYSERLHITPGNELTVTIIST